MLNNFEKLVRFIYRERKNSIGLDNHAHLSEEDLACFSDDKLNLKDKEAAIEHLLSCNICAEYLAAQLKIQPHLSLQVPELLLEKIKNIALPQSGENLLEIFIKLKEKAMEIIKTTGDVLVGQELVPAPVLRSRQVIEFKEEVTILKDLQQIRVVAKIQNKDIKNFNLIITATDKINQKSSKNLRIALLKDGIELESYAADSGASSFENILPGEYIIEISRLDQRVAVIDLKIKI